MIPHIIYIISIWIVVLPVVAGVVNYKGLNTDSRWIFYMSCLAVPPQLLTYLSVFRETRLLNIFYNAYTPLEFILMYLLFRPKYETRLRRSIQWWSAVAYGVISVYFVLVLARYRIDDRFLNLWVCANNLTYILWIMLFLQEQYNSDSFVIRRDNPFAWYVLAFIVYAPCTVLVFGLYYYIRDPARPDQWNMWVIQSVCNIILYIFFAAGLFISTKDEKRRIT